MMRTQLARMLQPGGRDHLGQRQQRVAVIVKDPLGLVGNDQSALPDGVLRSDAGGTAVGVARQRLDRSEEHTSELQSLMRISYAVFCLKKKTKQQQQPNDDK